MILTGVYQQMLASRQGVGRIQGGRRRFGGHGYGRRQRRAARPDRRVHHRARMELIVAGSADRDELLAGVAHARDRFVGLGIVLVIAFAVFFTYVARRLVSRPLDEVIGLSERFAAGDLRARPREFAPRRDRAAHAVDRQDGQRARDDRCAGARSRDRYFARHGFDRLGQWPYRRPHRHAGEQSRADRGEHGGIELDRASQCRACGASEPTRCNCIERGARGRPSRHARGVDDGGDQPVPRSGSPTSPRSSRRSPSRRIFSR